MAVQINEVIIRTVVDPAPSTGNAEADCPPTGSSGSDADMLEKILDIIREKQQR